MHRMGEWHCGGGAADRMDGRTDGGRDGEDNGMPSEEGRNVTSAKGLARLTKGVHVRARASLDPSKTAQKQTDNKRNVNGFIAATCCTLFLPLFCSPLAIARTQTQRPAGSSKINVTLMVALFYGQAAQKVKLFQD